MSVMNKQHIRRRFQKARNTYDQQAVVQARMARTLLELIRKFGGDCFPRTLEIGCGTGLLTNLLLAACRIEHYWANDLALDSTPPLHFQPKKSFVCLPGDAEKISDFPSGLHLICSNAALHWIQDFPAFLAKLHPLLESNGWLAFSSFGPDNFSELKELGCSPLAYSSLAQTVGQMQTGFAVVHQAEAKIALRFPDAQSALRHLQALGVTGLTSGFWSKSRLQQLLDDYQERYALEGGVRLTYHPTFIVARKISACP